MALLNIVAILCVLVVRSGHLANSAPGCDFLKDKPESNRQVIKYGNSSELTIDGYIALKFGVRQKYLALTNAISQHRFEDRAGLKIDVVFECASVTITTSDLQYATFGYKFIDPNGETATCKETRTLFLRDGELKDKEKEVNCIYPSDTKIGLRYIKIVDSDSE